MGYFKTGSGFPPFTYHHAADFAPKDPSIFVSFLPHLFGEKITYKACSSNGSSLR